MRKTAVVSAALVLAALTGCGSAASAHHPHHPAKPVETAAQRHGAHTICDLFVAATKLAGDLGGTSGAAEQQMMNKVLYGKHVAIDPQVLRDAEALVAAPTSTTVQRLQA